MAGRARCGAGAGCSAIKIPVSLAMAALVHRLMADVVVMAALAHRSIAGVVIRALAQRPIEATEASLEESTSFLEAVGASKSSKTCSSSERQRARARACPWRTESVLAAVHAGHDGGSRMSLAMKTMWRQGIALADASSSSSLLSLQVLEYLHPLARSGLKRSRGCPVKLKRTKKSHEVGAIEKLLLRL